MNKKTAAMLLALALMIGAAAGGSLAWLTDKTDEVKNTFTTSDIDIELEETTGKSYQMIPGYTITKDPKVTVKAVSEKCFVFIKVEKANNFDGFMTYEMAKDANGNDIWTKLENVDNVYYRVVEDTDADQEFAVIKDNTITVKDTVTKADMNGVTTNPTLTVTAYACQYNNSNNTNFTAAEAWAKVSPTTAP